MQVPQHELLTKGPRLESVPEAFRRAQSVFRERLFAAEITRGTNQLTEVPVAPPTL